MRGVGGDSIDPEGGRGALRADVFPAGADGKIMTFPDLTRRAARQLLQRKPLEGRPPQRKSRLEELRFAFAISAGSDDDDVRVRAVGKRAPGGASSTSFPWEEPPRRRKKSPMANIGDNES